MKRHPLIRRALTRLLIVLFCTFSIVSISFSEDNLVIANGTTVNLSDAPEVIVDQALPSAREVKSTLDPASAADQVSTKRLWNLQDADILSVINEVSQETGKNFVVDPRVSGKITLISSKPLKQSEVYQVFLSVLGMLGFSAIPSGKVIKIVPNMESGEQATAVVTKRSTIKGEEVVVRVIPLENVSATQLIPALRPLLPQWSNISAYMPGNVLIILGRAANLERIYKIIQDVDKASTNGIEIIPLKHASAVQVAQVLNNLQTAARAAGEASGISIAVDERSNSLLLSGPKAMRVHMRILIAQLDAPAATGSGNTEVIYLRYLQAKTFAPLLSKIAQNIVGKDTGTHYEASTAVTSPANLTTVASASQSTSSVSSYIQAEPTTNAIIITAPKTLMQALKVVIAKLDIRPAQVLVEAIIAEIDEDNLATLGIQWGSITPSGEVAAGSTGGSPFTFPSFNAGVVGIMPHVQIKAVLTALRNQNGVDILSTPQIVVLDNQKASIEIGQDVPELTGTYSTTGTTGTVTPFNTFGRLKVTLKLEVTPQINLGSSVRLKLDLKNDTLQNPQNPTLNPLINTSQIKNSVIVNSDDVLVLGGLFQNANNDVVNKVPILGDVPIVGVLFRQKTAGQQKKSLLVFIKPIIMCSSEDAMTISYMKYNNIRRTQANFRDTLATIGDQPVETKMPPWKNKQDLPPPFDSRPA